MEFPNAKNMNFQYVLVLTFGIQLSIGSTNSTFREHKVHNIVLYPDKHSWCTSTSIKQVISAMDCDPVEIDNRVCLGACFSYSIPRTLPADNSDEVNSYCDSCQPIKTLWIPIQLSCNGGTNHTKHVQLIKECRCSSCSRHWELENPVTNIEDEDTSTTQTSRYLELMKLEHDENDEDEDNTTDIANTEIIAAVNSTRVMSEKTIWIRGPHHSKVLLKKEIVNVPDIANEEAQQYLEDTADKNKVL
ncbi:neuroblastoma suppressor of tumorigenicity 1-like [Sipha flava]|uniref:Neuroblastoma suppressor of tumorigenicity 1-like n=1 Tax=Sipha flava TaxID=143950 RepID=A0A8B8F2Q4_9HEMI|nr:neuroblastoma suppressor of tumorigenicity 1-like [Sipha flava]